MDVMYYKPTEQYDEIEVHVYNISLTAELDAVATCWVPSKSCWLTTPIYTLLPFVKKKRILKE